MSDDRSEKNGNKVSYGDSHADDDTSDCTTKSVLYDANCIIYHCFFATEKYKKKTIQFKYPHFSEKTQKLTNFFCKENIRIMTISSVWEEIFVKGIAVIVEEAISDNYSFYSSVFRKKRFPPVVKLRLVRKLERKILGLEEKGWFEVVDFNPPEKEVEDVVKFYLSQKRTETMEKIRELKGRYRELPSRADISLLKYSQVKKIPILTNDMDLIWFRKELEKQNICYKIYPLLDVTIEELEANFRC